MQKNSARCIQSLFAPILEDRRQLIIVFATGRVTNDL